MLQFENNFNFTLTTNHILEGNHLNFDLALYILVSMTHDM